MSRSQRIVAWIAGIACVACCAIPILGIGVGAAGIAGLAAYSEVIAAIAAGFAAAIFIAWRVMRRRVPACKIDGSCNTTKDNNP
jgi:hypothetical protein